MKKLFKRIIAVLAVAVLMLSLTACGEIKKAETTVNNMFTAFKAADFDKAREYIDVDKIISEESDNKKLVNAETIMKTLFDRLNYEIISSEKVDENTVIVKTKITAVDMKPVIGEFFKSAMQYAISNAFANPTPSEEEMNKKMEELFVAAATKPDLATVTNEVDIKVISTDNTWKVASDETFANALLGGLLDSIKDIQNSFKK